MKGDKKGFLMSDVTIKVILIMLGLTVILFLIWQINWKGTIDRETCHQSVIFKATVPEDTIIHTGQKIVDLPLRCETEKICISKNSLLAGNCGDELGSNFKTERVSGTKEQKEQQIKEIIANSIYDCWSVMGEGKLQIFSRGVDSFSDSKTGVICARIAFDEDLKKEIENVDGMNEYLIKTKVPYSDLTYHQYLTNSRQSPAYTPDMKVNDKFNTQGQKAVIYLEVGNSALPDLMSVWGSVAAAASAGAIIGSVVPIPLVGTAAGAVGGAAAGAVIGYVSGGVVKEEVDKFLNENKASTYGVYLFIEYNKETINDLEVEDFENFA